MCVFWRYDTYFVDSVPINRITCNQCCIAQNKIYTILQLIICVSGNIMFSSTTQPPPSKYLGYLGLVSIIDIVVPSKMAAGGHFVQKFQKTKLRIDLKRPEMPSKVNFANLLIKDANVHRRPFCKIKSKINKILYWSKMARNAIEGENFGHPKWEPAAIL